MCVCACVCTQNKALHCTAVLKQTSLKSALLYSSCLFAVVSSTAAAPAPAVTAAVVAVAAVAVVVVVVVAVSPSDVAEPPRPPTRALMFAHKRV